MGYKNDEFNIEWSNKGKSNKMRCANQASNRQGNFCPTRFVIRDFCYCGKQIENQKVLDAKSRYTLLICQKSFPFLIIYLFFHWQCLHHPYPLPLWTSVKLCAAHWLNTSFWFYSMLISLTKKQKPVILLSRLELFLNINTTHPTYSIFVCVLWF